MVKMRRRKYSSTYDSAAMTDLESATAEAIGLLEREKAGTYRVVAYTGQPVDVAIWDLVVFRVPGTVKFPSPSPANAGKRIAIQCEIGGTPSTVTATTGTINGSAFPYTLAIAGRIREFVSNGIGWCSHA